MSKRQRLCRGEDAVQSEVSQKHKNIVYERVYVESGKMVSTNLFAKQRWRRRCRDKRVDTKEGRRGGVG